MDIVQDEELIEAKRDEAIAKNYNSNLYLADISTFVGLDKQDRTISNHIVIDQIKLLTQRIREIEDRQSSESNPDYIDLQTNLYKQIDELENHLITLNLGLAFDIAKKISRRLLDTYIDDDILQIINRNFIQLIKAKKAAVLYDRSISEFSTYFGDCIWRNSYSKIQRYLKKNKELTVSSINPEVDELTNSIEDTNAILVGSQDQYEENPIIEAISSPEFKDFLARKQTTQTGIKKNNYFYNHYLFLAKQHLFDLIEDQDFVKEIINYFDGYEFFEVTDDVLNRIFKIGKGRATVQARRKLAAEIIKEYLFENELTA